MSNISNQSSLYTLSFAHQASSLDDQRPIGKLFIPISHAVVFQLATLVVQALTAIGEFHEPGHDTGPVADVVAQIGDSDFRRNVDPKRASVFGVGVKFGSYE